jgi:hypothetical protein
MADKKSGGGSIPRGKNAQDLGLDDGPRERNVSVSNRDVELEPVSGTDKDAPKVTDDKGESKPQKK